MPAQVKINLVCQAPKPTTKHTKIDPSIVTPGDIIPTNHNFMRGHGTYITEQQSTLKNDNNQQIQHPNRQIEVERQLNASLAGVIDHIGSLVSIRPLRTRYQAKIGDVIVGRIKKVEQNRWKVDIGGHLYANLNLTSIDLPGGELRRRDELDELSMRKHLCENDLISAEVQKIVSNESGGLALLHTRSLRYGKLNQGILLKCSPSLIQPRKNHFHTFPFGISIIIGNNGFIWLSPTDQENTTSISVSIRENLTRIRNCILMLIKFNMLIYDVSILTCYDYGKDRYSTKDLLEFSVQEECTSHVKNVLSEEESYMR